MVQDRILVWKFNRGSKDALRRIYERYKDDLLGLAVMLLRDRSLAEDVVHSVFVTFAQSVGTFYLTGTLKGYLATCVANRARDVNRLKRGKSLETAVAEEACSKQDAPVNRAMSSENSQRLAELLRALVDDQREVIILHLHHGMRFREIAKARNVSVNTIQSRYRYGLEKLRAMLNSEMENDIGT